MCGTTNVSSCTNKQHTQQTLGVTLAFLDGLLPEAVTSDAFRFAGDFLGVDGILQKKTYIAKITCHNKMNAPSWPAFTSNATPSSPVLLPTHEGSAIGHQPASRDCQKRDNQQAGVVLKNTGLYGSVYLPFFFNSTCWMFGSTPPEAMVTPLSSLFSSSSLRMAN